MSRDLDRLIRLVNYVRTHGKPNVYGARVPLQTPWNLELMSQLATSTSDQEVVEFMRYGWPLNHDGRPMAVTFFNHASALRYPGAMEDYIWKEQQLGCLLGPFATLPWCERIAVSPMSMRPKKDSSARQIIMDLNWPHDGTSVNDGISKEKYVGQLMCLQYPRVDYLCQKAVEMGQGVMGYKIDMDRAFKQLIMDVSDWPLLGISWKKMVFFDKTAVMGSRSAPYICQRVTNFIRHIMLNLAYFIANYVDDFMGLEYPERVWQSFNTLRNLLRDLGASEATQKAVLPTYIIEFLGVLFDLITMTISITPKRMEGLLHELEEWEMHRSYNRVQLESLLGKLQFVSNCVQPGRLLIFRLRNALHEMGRGWHRVTQDMRKDINWWRRFLPQYDRVSIMWMDQRIHPDSLMAMGACLTGIGAISGKEYLHAEIPLRLVNDPQLSIAHYEMWAIVIGLRKWGKKFKGVRFCIQCDNQAVVDVINKGTARDKRLQQLLRLFVFECAVGKLEVVAKHLMGSLNQVPDLLSRFHLGLQFQQQFAALRAWDWQEVIIEEPDWEINDSW